MAYLPSLSLPLAAALLAGCTVAPNFTTPEVDDRNPFPNDNTAIRFQLGESPRPSPFGTIIYVSALRQTGTRCRYDLPSGGTYYGSCPAMPSKILAIECFPSDACEQVTLDGPTGRDHGEGSLVPARENVLVRVTADFSGDVEVRDMAYDFSRPRRPTARANDGKTSSPSVAPSSPAQAPRP